jgi:hypothetical protein
MKLIGLLTEDPRTYFEVLEILREENLKFVSLDFSETVPANVGVIITTRKELPKVFFDRVVTDDDPQSAVARARRMIAGEGEVGELTIGIDPGTKPGFAVIADGMVLMRSVAPSPEAVGHMVDDIVKEYPTANVIVRIGHGDRINRNRIFNSLWEGGHKIEIVDERNTTRKSHTPDEDAAVEIALTPGYQPRKKQIVEPAPGEVKNIQRISRLESRGSVTISQELARRIAKGELTMEDAIEEQKKQNGND